MNRPPVPIFENPGVGIFKDNSQCGKLDWRHDRFEWMYVPTGLVEHYPCCVCREPIELHTPVYYSVCRMQAAHKDCSMDYSKLPIWAD